MNQYIMKKILFCYFKFYLRTGKIKLICHLSGKGKVTTRV